MSNRSTERDERIVAAGLEIALSQGLAAVTRSTVAARAGVSQASVSNYGRRVYGSDSPISQVGTLDALRRAVVTLAVERAVLPVIAQALAQGYEEARQAPEELRARALAEIIA